MALSKEPSRHCGTYTTVIAFVTTRGFSPCMQLQNKLRQTPCIERQSSHVNLTVLFLSAGCIPSSPCFHIRVIQVYIQHCGIGVWFVRLKGIGGYSSERACGEDTVYLYQCIAA